MKHQLSISNGKAGVVVSVAAGLLFNAGAAHSMVLPTTLAEMVATSDLVVLGRVLEVETVAGGPVATMQIREVWKGRSGPTIRYDVRRAWTCDISDAQVGETSVIFLVGDAPSGAMVLALSGRGRLPIEARGGIEYVPARTSGLVLPIDLPVEWRTTSNGTFKPWVKLSDLRDYVKGKAETHRQSDEPPNNRLKLAARGRSAVESRLRTRAAA